MASVYKRKLKNGDYWHGSVRLSDGSWKAYNTDLPTATCTKEQATEHARRVQAELDAGRDPFREEGRPFKEQVCRLADEFLTDRNPHWSVGTLDLYADTMKVICDLFGNRDIRTFCKADVNGYREFLQKRGAINGRGRRLRDMHVNTLNRYLRSLRAFLRWCADDGGIAGWTPPRVRELPAPPSDLPDYFTPEEFEKLLSAADKVTFNGASPRLLIALLGCTGMRRNEALALDWSMIDMEAKRIVLTWSITKTKRSRIIPVTPILSVILDQLPEPRVGKVFPQFTENISKVFKKVCVAAGVPVRPLHKLRDTFAVNAAVGGLAPLFLGKILGHAKLQTTYKYYFTPDADAISEQLNASENYAYSSAVLRGIGKPDR